MSWTRPHADARSLPPTAASCWPLPPSVGFETTSLGRSRGASDPPAPTRVPRRACRQIRGRSRPQSADGRGHTLPPIASSIRFRALTGVLALSLVSQLRADPAVHRPRNIYEFVLGGETDTKLLEIRIFDANTKRVGYEQQTKKAKAAGVYVFGGGIDEAVPPVLVSPDGAVAAGGYSWAPPLNGGFTVLELPPREAAVAWAARIARACRCDQELRLFGFDPQS